MAEQTERPPLYFLYATLRTLFTFCALGIAILVVTSIFDPVLLYETNFRPFFLAAGLLDVGCIVWLLLAH